MHLRHISRYANIEAASFSGTKIWLFSVLPFKSVYLVFLPQSQDMVLNQKAEEAKQMKQDLQRVQSLFSSAERELRYEKEKNMDLKRHNTLLDQEKLKVGVSLKHLHKFPQLNIITTNKLKSVI